MIIRRYWSIAVFAPFGGFLLAAVVAIIMTDAGSGENEYRFWFVVRSMANYGVIGMVIATVALIGGLAAITLFDRPLTKRVRVRVALAGAGALVGVIMFSFIIALVLLLIDAGAYATITLAFGVVMGAASSVVAALMLLYAERHTH